MNDKFTVNAFFGDGERPFALHDGKSLDLVRELQTKLDAGPMVVFRRIYSGNYVIDDIREVLRLGLIGGGATASEASRLVKLYLDREPLVEHAGLALEVLSAVLFGKGAQPAPEPDAA